MEEGGFWLNGLTRDECATCYALPATEAIGFPGMRRVAPYPGLEQIRPAVALGSAAL